MQLSAIKQIAWWLVRHAFIIATGFTALLHSTWALATIFNGLEPQQLSLSWFAWVIPAFVFAFSIDVGQIATSVDIRNGERTPAKYATFAVLAIATYYLQWWFIAAHIPMVNLSPGVANSYLSSATFLRDLALWIVPGMLPASTLFYTFSYAKPKRISQGAFRAPTYARTANDSANSEQMKALPTGNLTALPEPTLTAMYIAKCEQCGREWPCETERQRVNKLNAHNPWCSAKVER
jgi:hypothetical protein